MKFQPDDEKHGKFYRDDFDMLDFIIAFESGNIESNTEIYEGFQHLIDSGAAWTLQGSYGRLAKQLIDLGHWTR